jgi:hypothetical protein
MNKALCLSISICTLAGSLALALPGTATAASSPGGMALAPAFSGRLYGVVAISNRDVWAVGLCCSGSLIVHWNGSTWSQSEPNGGYFNGVGASSADDVWAVGGTNWFSPSSTLAEHWNGSSWRQIATPNPAGGGQFSGVTATSSSNAWAVGLVGGGPGSPGPTTPLIEHWNGRTWTIQHFQEPAGGGQFGGVAALSPSNAWAVGNTGDANERTGQTLIEHWNGRNWTRIPSPNEGEASFLHSVAVISSDNAWAVGYYIAADGTYRTLALYWNGKRWTVVPSQTPGGDGQFLGVAASWTHNVWAVGIRNPTRCGNGGPPCKTLIEHWDSKRWTLLASPNPPSRYLNVLWGVSAVSRSDIWAAGSTDYASTLMIHWNGTSWS